MNIILISAGILVVILIIFALSKKGTPKSSIAQVDYYGQNKPLNELLAAELAAGRIPVVYFWAAWCGPSIEFKNALSHPLMEDALKNVVLLMIDADVDSEKENLARRYGARNIPAFVKVDENGKSIGFVDGGAWNENTPENMAPVLKKFITGN